MYSKAASAFSPSLDMALQVLLRDLVTLFARVGVRQGGGVSEWTVRKRRRDRPRTQCSSVCLTTGDTEVSWRWALAPTILLSRNRFHRPFDPVTPLHLEICLWSSSVRLPRKNRVYH